MSHIPNQYNNVPGQPNSIPGTSPQYNQIPTSQLPGTAKQGGMINPTSIAGYTSQTNHYNHSANSSPAFNNPGMMAPPPTSLQSSPMRPLKPVQNQNPMQNIQNIPYSSTISHSLPNVSSQYPPNFQPQQINNNAPPLISSSQYNQPIMNGPSGPSAPLNQYPLSSSFSPPPITNLPPTSATSYGPRPPNPAFSSIRPPTTMPPGLMTSQPNIFNGPPISAARNSPLATGPPVNNLPPASVPNLSGPVPPKSNIVNGPAISGPPSSMGPQMPPRGLPSGPIQTGPTSSLPRPPMPPNINQPLNGPINQMDQNYTSVPSSLSTPFLPSGPMSQPVPTSGASGPSTMQNRYPQMPYSNLSPQQQMQVQQNIAKQFPTHNLYGVTQQMGNLSVTKQGFDQLWGHQMVDLLQCKNILPEYPEEPMEIKLGNQFADAPNCSPEIFRCTVNRIPETNSLLQKSRLPLGILIHPFKDLNHLPVIQCTSIVRCRACRTYINPFVYFVDSKRWKCNLCFRVNELPDEFQYDPLSKSYGDPSRRPEIKSATIEFIAPSEYMLRPPQPAVYLFLLDVSQIARDSGYLQVVCDTLKENLDKLPGDARTQIGFICYDAHIHYYLMSEGLTRPKEMTVLDVDDVFLPSPESLLVNLGEHRELVRELLGLLPARHAAAAPGCALGAALQAAYKLMSPTGGRVTVFQTCLPNVGPGALQSREDPNARSSKEVAHLNPATDFYKRLALDCSGAQIAVDLFLLSQQYCDLATLSGISKFSAGTVYHLPLFRARAWQAARLAHVLERYLTRKIGFEAVMRVRCTRGVTIHTFHGNFFVRSTDLLSLPNVSPDAGFGMQLAIEESLSDLQQVCFQAALLYTSSKGERRIRVHTLALPIASTLPDVLHSADQQCIIGLLSKMAVDRAASASMPEAKEALINVAVDVLSAHRLAQNLPQGANSTALHAPMCLRLLPLYILALLKRKAFRTGTSTRLDERVADMCLMKCAPLSQLLRAVYPDLYPLLPLHAPAGPGPAGPAGPGPAGPGPAGPVGPGPAGPGPAGPAGPPHREDDLPRLQLTAERINMNGAYLLDDGETMIIYVCHGVSPAFLSDMFGVAAFSQIQDEGRELPRVDTEGNEALHAFIEKLNDDRPYPSGILILRDNSPSRNQFTERLIEDRVESAFSYYEFLQHVKTQVK